MNDNVYVYMIEIIMFEQQSCGVDESDNVYAWDGDGHTFWGQSPYSNAPVIPTAAATTTGDKHVMPEHNSFLGHTHSKNPPLFVRTG